MCIFISQEAKDRARAKKDAQTHRAAAAPSASGSAASRTDTLSVPSQVEHAVRQLLEPQAASEPKDALASQSFASPSDTATAQQATDATTGRGIDTERNAAVSVTDLRAKISAELQKKGFANTRIQQAIDAAFMRETHDDKLLNFNQQRRRLLDSAKDWLVLNCEMNVRSTSHLKRFTRCYNGTRCLLDASI